MPARIASTPTTSNTIIIAPTYIAPTPAPNPTTNIAPNPTTSTTTTTTITTTNTITTTMIYSFYWHYYSTNIMMILPQPWLHIGVFCPTRICYHCRVFFLKISIFPTQQNTAYSHVISPSTCTIIVVITQD